MNAAPPARAHAKHLGFVSRKDGMSLDAFADHWLGRHVPLCLALPGLLRYSVNLVDRERFPHLDCDGFSELWFGSEEAIDAALASPQGQALLADLPNFVGRRVAVRVRELPQLWP